MLKHGYRLIHLILLAQYGQFHIVTLQYMYRKIGVYVDKTFDKNDYSSDMVCVERSGRILREETVKLIQFIQERRMFYKCVGRLIGLSIINRQPLSTSFPLLFFKQLLEIPFEFDDLKDIDLQVYKSLIRLKQQDKDEFVTNEKSVNVIPLHQFH